MIGGMGSFGRDETTETTREIIFCLFQNILEP